MKNGIKNKMNAMALRVKDFLSDERGEGHLLAVVVIAVIVVGLAVLFGDELTQMVQGMLAKMKTDVSPLTGP